MSHDENTSRNVINILAFFSQTNLSLTLTAGDGGPSTGCQTHLNA